MERDTSCVAVELRGERGQWETLYVMEIGLIHLDSNKNLYMLQTFDLPRIVSLLEL